jgi:hypothetical protein
VGLRDVVMARLADEESQKSRRDAGLPRQAGATKSGLATSMQLRSGGETARLLVQRQMG